MIGITESWATEKNIQEVLQLEGYTCYRRDRMSKYSTKGGGLLMYMKDTFGHRLLENITINRSIEALWGKIIIDNKKNDKVIIGYVMTVQVMMKKKVTCYMVTYTKQWG